MSAGNWQERPLVEAAAKPRNPISRALFELVSARAIAGFGLVFGAQTVLPLLAQLPEMTWPLAQLGAFLVFAGLVVVMVAAILQRGIRAAMTYAAIAFLIVVVTWPLTAVGPTFDPGSKPWVWYLCTVATAFAAFAFPLWWAVAYTVITPIAYAVIRTLPSGGGVSTELAVLDAVYAIILGGAILVMMTMLRQAASAVDSAQSTALEKYGNAVREHAMEVERVQVDAIVHDSVLTTLLSAASATTTQERELAAKMARDAIGHLRAAEAVDPDDQSLIGLDRLSVRIKAAAAAFSSPFEISVSEITSQTVPVPVAEAIYSATVQAMVNSLQHAGDTGVERSLAIRGGDLPDVVTVTVADTGAGFDPDAVPPERLGLRVSITERIANVGGYAAVHSQPGQGTDITLHWPCPSEITPKVSDAARVAAAERPLLDLPAEEGREQ